MTALPRTSLVAPRVLWLDSVGSTNTALADAVQNDPSEWPEWSVVATDDQTGGRGRLGRVWSAPGGSAIAVSVLLRPRLPLSRFGWLPLLAGVAMVGAVRHAGADATLKWPNDVLIGGRKVSGLLAEVLPGNAVILGAGVNTRMRAADLPVPTATSLGVEGADTDADALLASYISGLQRLLGGFETTGGDPEASGARESVESSCETVGARVRVDLPDGTILVGTATGLDDDGRIVIRQESGERVEVSAGDVTHLRHQ